MNLMTCRAGVWINPYVWDACCHLEGLQFYVGVDVQEVIGAV